MQRFNQCISVPNVKLLIANIMQEHIYTAQIICSNIDFLSEKSLPNILFSQNLCKFKKQ